MESVVLAYSGGLDTSVAVRWLKEKYNLDVITFTVDIGNVADLDAIRQKALDVGAIKALVVDAKESFINSFVFPALKADAIYDSLVVDRNRNIFGLIYEIEGSGAASPYQFFLTDSLSNFVRGALYFNVVPNNDSLEPVINFIIEDIEHLINTFQWKEKE